MSSRSLALSLVPNVARVVVVFAVPSTSFPVVHPRGSCRVRAGERGTTWAGGEEKDVWQRIVRVLCITGDGSTAALDLTLGLGRTQHAKAVAGLWPRG